MKKYDYDLAKKIIEKEKDSIDRAALGMAEDWFWTADTIYENGIYTKELIEETKLGGLDGSIWATPALRIEYKDGKEKMFNCYKGESEGERPVEFALGFLSSPCQEDVPEVEEWNEPEERKEL